MVAHLDAVTSLAVDPNGLYLLSGKNYFNLYWILNISIYFYGYTIKICAIKYNDNDFLLNKNNYYFISILKDLTTVRFGCGI